MKILVVCQYYYPENFQITPICEQLAKDGFEVTVLTGLPNYPTGNIPAAYQKGHRDEWVNGVHVIRSFEIGRKKGIARLVCNYFSYWLSASIKIREMPQNFDMVFVYQLSPVMMGLPARWYAKKYRKPLLLYCCDLWPESLKMYIKNEKNVVYACMKRISRRVYSACDHIFTQSSSFVEYLAHTHGLAGEKIQYLPAFADETYLREDFTPEDQSVDFVFLGNLGIAQDLLAVLAAINNVRDLPDVRFHFVGDGTMLNEMKQYVQKRGLEELVLFYGRRPVEEMPEFYRLADACIVSLNAENKTGLSLPAKVQGYMAAGKPILGMISGSAQEVVREAQCGLCVDAGDVAGFSAVLREFATNKSRYQNCGANGRAFFEKNFRKETFIRNLEKKIREMC